MHHPRPIQARLCGGMKRCRFFFLESSDYAQQRHLFLTVEPGMLGCVAPGLPVLCALQPQELHPGICFQKRFCPGLTSPGGCTMYLIDLILSSIVRASPSEVSVWYQVPECCPAVLLFDAVSAWRSPRRMHPNGSIQGMNCILRYIELYHRMRLYS